MTTAERKSRSALRVHSQDMEDIIIDHKPKNAPSRSVLWPLLSLGIATGCGSQAGLPMENLGNTSDNLGGVVVSATGKERLNGRWVGQAREPGVEIDGESVGYTFPSGSRDITIELLFDEDSFISGNVVFGAGTPPAPEAGVSYPQGLDYGLSISQELPPVEGFAYELAEEVRDFGSEADEFASLTYDQFGAFAQWCPLQEPRANSDDHYTCLGFDGYGGTLTDDGYVCSGTRPDGSRVNVDCNMVALCGQGTPCSCSAGGCSQQPSPLLAFVELTGDELTASFGQTMVDVGLPDATLETLKPLRLQRVAP